MRHHIAELDTCVARSKLTMDPAARTAERAEHAKKFSKLGPWPFAPVSERRRSELELEADQHRRAQEAQWLIESYLREHKPEVEAAIVEAQRAPGPEAAHTARSGRKGGNLEETYLRELLDETRRSRLRAELDTASPSAVLAAYREALRDSSEQSAATLIAYVERRHGTGWAGPASADPGEVAAAVELRNTISATQRARVPSELFDVMGAFEAASAYAAKISALGVQPLKPELEDE